MCDISWLVYIQIQAEYSQFAHRCLCELIVLNLNLNTYTLTVLYIAQARMQTNPFSMEFFCVLKDAVKHLLQCALKCFAALFPVERGFVC